MSDKPLRSVFSKIWPSGRTGAEGGSRSAHTCAKGHPMDPSWTECPVCRAESRSQEKTSADDVPYDPREDIKRSHNMSRSPTMTPGSMNDPERAPTRIDTGDDDYTAPVRHQSAARRMITGVLVTDTWDRQGELFVLYEGRNVIGKGEVASEGGRPCDVLLHSDPMMSNEHAMILCRQGRYDLYDQRSTNGTFLDDVFVENNGASLEDGACIKTGNTIWLFRKIVFGGGRHTPAPGPGPAHHHGRRDDDPDERPVRDPSTIY